jgi:hypothetical protein
MATWIPVRRKCVVCGGDGIFTSPSGDSIPCPSSCEGTGYCDTGMAVDITDLQADMTKALRRIKKIMDKLEIADN